MTQINDDVLEKQHFAQWTETLLAKGEVWLHIDFVSQFSSYLKAGHHNVWLRTEQDNSVNERWEARFYLRV